MAKTCPRQHRQRSTPVLYQWVSVNLTVSRKEVVTPQAFTCFLVFTETDIQHSSYEDAY